GVDVVDVIGDHLGAAIADRDVEVAIGDQAQPLVPRVVARLEVGVDVVALGQVAHRDLADPPLHEARCLAGQQPDQAFQQRVTLPDDRVGNPARQYFSQQVYR